MEKLFEETWGNGLLQYRTIFLTTFEVVAIQGIYQLPIFYGQVKPHLCEILNNGELGDVIVG